MSPCFRHLQRRELLRSKKSFRPPYKKLVPLIVECKLLFMLNKILGVEPHKSLPLLTLLPHKGDCRELSAYKADFISRIEEIRLLLQEPQLNKEEKNQLIAEESILKQVLNWMG